MQTATLKFNATKVRKLIKNNSVLDSYYKWRRWGKESDTQALRKTFEEMILPSNKFRRKYDAGETRKKLGRPPILDVPFIPDREYSKNWKMVDEIAGKLGCNLTGFHPDWLIHYEQHPMDISYEVMRQLALLLGYKWIDKKSKGGDNSG